MGFFGGGSKKPKPQIVAHKYHVGMHMIVGHSHMDALEKIRVGEKTAWSNSESVKQSFTSVSTAYNTPHPDIVLAQTFTTGSSYTLSSVTLKLRRISGDLPGTVTVSIRATDGSGLPIGSDLCVGTTDGNTILNNPASLSLSTERNIKFDIPITLDASTKYAICLRTSNAPDKLFWIGNSTGGYSGGNYLNSAYRGEEGTWNDYPGIDFWFKTYSVNGTPPNSSISISSNNLFGGDRKEGGISGTVDLLFGASDQAQNSYLAARLGSAITAFRGLTSFVLRQVYVGTSPYIKPWAFFCKRVGTQISGLDQWYKEKAILNPRAESGDDLNAIHIIRECLIDPEWGLGFDASEDFDNDSWEEAADILYAENFGLSLEWDQSQPVEDFVSDVLKTINGMLYQDLSSGKWVITLTREPSVAEILRDSHTDDDQFLGTTYGAGWWGQTFTPSVDYTLSSIKLKLKRTGNPVVPMTISIRATTEFLPTGNDLAVGTLQTEDVTTDANGDWYEFDFRHGAVLTAGQRYAIVFRVPNGNLLNSVNLFIEYNGLYLDGTSCSSGDSGSSWIFKNYDISFKTYSHGMLKDIPIHGVGDIIEIEDFVRPSYGEIVDQVIVSWWDKVADKSRPAMAHDIALIEKQNGTIIEQTISYYGICNAKLANTVAERELNLASGMLATMRIKATRKLSGLKPNEIFKLTWPALRIVQMVVRVMEADYGDLDKPEVYFNCVEDSFLTALTIYSDPPESLWSDLVSDAVDIVDRRLIEVPYFSLCNDFENQSIINGYDDDAGFFYIIASPPVEDSFDFNYEIKHTAGLDYNLEGVGTYSPTATIASDIARTAVDLDISLGNISNLEQVVIGSYAIINDEIVRVNSVDIDNNQINVSRGILDTVPEAHSSGDRIYFAGTNYEGVNTEYTSGEDPLVKMYPRTGKGILSSTDVTTQITMGSRMIRPYPPGNLKFNGDSYPEWFSTGANGNKITLTWNHRDRTASAQLQSLIAHTYSSNIGPETNVTYVIKIYDEDGLNVQVYDKDTSPAAASPFEYTEAMEIADFGRLQDTLRFVIYAVRDGYNSWNDGYDITLRRSFRGTVDATSSLTGDISTYFERNQNIDAVSFVNGTLSVATQLAGSTAGTGGASGALNSQPELKGSAAGISSVGGTLTV